MLLFLTYKLGFSYTLLFWVAVSLTAVGCHVITPAPRLPLATYEPGDMHNAETLGEWQDVQLYKRAADTCDPFGDWICPIGTCYGGIDGFIGCCSVSSCTPRTACWEYDSQHPNWPYCNDRDTGGCLYCSDPASPYCATQTNIVMNLHVFYCEAYRMTLTLSKSWPPGFVLTTVEIKTITASAASRLPNSSSPTPAALASTASVSISSNSPETPSSSLTGRPTSESSKPIATTPINSSDELSSGAVAAVSIGATVAACGIACLIIWCLQRHKKLAKRQASTSVSGDEKVEPEPTSIVPGHSEIEGSTPGPSQQPWSPDSIVQHPASPELDSVPVDFNQDPYRAPYMTQRYKRHKPISYPPSSITGERRGSMSSCDAHSPKLTQSPTGQFSLTGLSPCPSVRGDGTPHLGPQGPGSYLSVEDAMDGGYWRAEARDRELAATKGLSFGAASPKQRTLACGTE